MPSQQAQQQYQAQLFEYKNKMKAAEQTDVMISAKVTENQMGMDLLNKSRGEIAAMIPQSNGQGDISANPVVVTLKE